MVGREIDGRLESRFVSVANSIVLLIDFDGSAVSEFRQMNLQEYRSRPSWRSELLHFAEKVHSKLFAPNRIGLRFSQIVKDLASDGIGQEFENGADRETRRGFGFGHSTV
nr:hypothetical protein [Haladaptatus salinisoli]